jgi:hypothetical protein
MTVRYQRQDESVVSELIPYPLLFARRPDRQ